jgi:hypothetical protein
MATSSSSSYILLSTTVAAFAFVAALTLFVGPNGADGAQRVININGAWSPWSRISTPCLRKNKQGVMVSVSCGGGLQTKVRSCTNPRPQVREMTMEIWCSKSDIHQTILNFFLNYFYFYRSPSPSGSPNSS